MKQKHDRDRVPSKERVDGEGPIPADIMFIGEGPSGVEDEQGRPFVGPSGRVLDQLLVNNGLYREDVFITNVSRVWKGYGNKTTWADVLEWSEETEKDVLRCQPRYIGLLGAWAIRWFFQGEKVNLEWAHGLPFLRNNYTVMPMFHPANVFNNPENSPKLVSDFQQFAAMVKGRLEVQELTDEYPDAEYTELIAVDAVRDLFVAAIAFGKTKIYVDTEGWYFNPWGLSFTFDKGDGYVIHRDSVGAMKEFIRCILAGNWNVIVHNSLHDIEVLDALGLKSGTYQFEDTMVKAYLLQIEELGLKPLAKRHCGMDQMEYEEVMASAERLKAMTYLNAVKEWADKWESRQLDSGLMPQSKRSKKKTPILGSDGRKLQTTMKFPALRSV